MSLLAVSLGDRFCMNRKGGTGKGGWVNPQGRKASRLACRKDLVVIRWPISLLVHTNGLHEKQSFYLVGPPFQAMNSV